MNTKLATYSVSRVIERNPYHLFSRPGLCADYSNHVTKTPPQTEQSIVIDHPWGGARVSLNEGLLAPLFLCNKSL